MLKNKPGIYCLLNIVTNKRYVGSTKNLRTRKYDHFKKLRANRHINSNIQKEFNIYGESSFEFVVLEFVDNKYLLEKEQLWMNFLLSYKDAYGYNLSHTAGTNLGYKHTEESKFNMSNSHKGIPNTEEQKIKISNANKIAMLNNANSSKISIDQVKEIREMHKCGVKNIELSKIFNLDRSQISRIVNYKAFKYVP